MGVQGMDGASLREHLFIAVTDSSGSDQLMTFHENFGLVLWNYWFKTNKCTSDCWIIWKGFLVGMITFQHPLECPKINMQIFKWMFEQSLINGIIIIKKSFFVRNITPSPLLIQWLSMPLCFIISLKVFF